MNRKGQILFYTRLINELTVLYRSTDFNDKEIFELFVYLKKHELDEALPEIYKLCSLIVSIPYTTASVERSFSTLKRVKNYARNTMGEERLSALALISIEKEFLKSLRDEPDFYEKVLKKFCTKNRRIDLVYK